MHKAIELALISTCSFAASSLALPGVALADTNNAICVASIGGVDNTLVIGATDSCSGFVTVPFAGGVNFGQDGNEIIVGPSGSQTSLNADGSATFGGGATFNSGTQFNGNVAFVGGVQANQINTGSIVNSGSLSTSSLNTGAFHASGAGTFAGSLSSDSFFANSATIGALHVPGAATFNSTVTVGGKLTASQGLVVGAGATIDAGGNRIQNVGTPVADTDAANKAYVDGAVGGLQTNVASLTTTVADHETRLTNVETVNAQQDTRLTSVETVNTQQDAHLSAIDATNTQQDTRLTSVESVNTQQATHLTAIDATDTRQDGQISAIQTLDTQQSAQISTLQGQVGSLQSDVAGIHNDLAGLHQDIRRANGGIAAAVAIGGTMIVPDSTISISFNLATYRGEQGFSGAVVARLAPKIYAQAGVAGSSVRGSTTGRVGIAFGL
jgi:hypothetical protein